MKPIKNFPGYYITKDGTVYSELSGKLKPMKSWLDGKKLYLMVGLSKNGKVYKKLVHRLVAEAYIPNPKKLPEVNHKDKNTQNPKSSNLEWCTRKENLQDSYSTMSPVRNFVNCELLYEDIVMERCQSIEEASRIAAEKYGCSYSMINKHRQHKGYSIRKV